MVCEKLCPVDKRPCIEDLCAIYQPEERQCSWARAVPSDRPVPKRTGAEQKKLVYEKPSQFKAHLFD
jgi:hypothetical protein